jgi:hypothetical protein
MPEKPRDNPMHRLQNWRLTRYGNPVRLVSDGPTRRRSTPQYLAVQRK